MNIFIFMKINLMNMNMNKIITKTCEYEYKSALIFIFISIGEPYPHKRAESSTKRSAAPRSHPDRRTWPSTHRWCASTPPSPGPHLPLAAPLPTASTPRSSALPCACSSTYLLPLPFAEIILSFARI